MSAKSAFTPPGALFTLALALTALAPAARADNIDAPLTGYGEKILRDLRNEDVKNVAVLPFRVKRGTRPETFIAGPINAGMALRVENALIMNSPADEAKAIGIVRGAAAVAARAKVGEWFTNPTERKRLFDLSYPLAWGNRSEKPDAFITGLIENTGDREKTHVVIQAFYKKDPKTLVTLKEFTVDTDRSILSDLGYNFILPRSSAVKTRSGKERDKLAASLVRRRDQGQAPPAGTEDATPANVGGLTVTVKYDGNAQPIDPVQASPEYFIPPVKAGTKFVLGLEYNGKREDKIGALVLVDGVSTWQEQTGDRINMQKWLYSKEKHLGKTDVVEGYYQDVDGKNLKPFNVLTGDEAESRASQLTGRVGYIDIYVYEAGEGPGDERMQISTRGMARGRSATKPATLREAQTVLLQSNYVRKRLARGRDEEGGMLAPSPEAIEAGKIEQGTFPNARQIGHLAIKYYNPRTTQMSISK